MAGICSQSCVVLPPRLLFLRRARNPWLGSSSLTGTMMVSQSCRRISFWIAEMSASILSTMNYNSPTSLRIFLHQFLDALQALFVILEATGLIREVIRV
jgi:hypothetical protein